MQDIRKNIASLLREQQLGVLATHGDVYPYNTLVGFAVTCDLKRILFATIRSTRKFHNITGHPEVSLLVDSRGNSPEDFKDAQALTVLGSARESTGQQKEEHMSLYLSKHPYLEDFIKDPHCALVSISVKKYILVSRFQEVMELEM